jgi:Bacterial Ig-like domain (group 3)
MAIASPDTGRRRGFHRRGLSLAVSLALGAGTLAVLGAGAAPARADSGAASVFTADDLAVTVASSDTSVAPLSGISVTGTGADRTLTVTPGTVGYSTITLTVTAPDGSSAVTEVQYGVSAYLGDPGQRYFSGAGNGSTAIDVGGGYMIVGDDESNVLHLYNETQSGPPVASYDFTADLPNGTTSVDIESSARSGDMLYWTGSMTNNDSGDLAPARSTLFAAKITGSGADTQLTYVGSYTGLKDDLVSWDENDGSGLGANYFGFAASTAAGVDSHDADALDVEGMEFAPGSSTTAYLAFRAPLEPAGDRQDALLIPVTNIDQLVTGAATGATFGAPVLFNLGGLGIREIRQNADGQYLIIAGTPDGGNDDFQLYSWDGNPLDPPIESGTALPLEPSGANQGSWETIVSVPDPLASGSSVQLLEDNGDTAWYGDTLTSKTGLDAALQKDLGQVFTYQAGSALATTTALASSPASGPVAGQQVTYTATVAGPSGTLGTPTGTVDFQNGGTDVPGCSAQPLSGAGVATCTVAYPAIGDEAVTANYAGDPSFAASSSAAETVGVAQDATVTTVTSSANPASYDGDVTVQAQVKAAAPGSGTPTGKVVFTVLADGRSRAIQCSGTSTSSPGTVGLSSGVAQCVVNTKSFASPGGTYAITASYSGDANYLPGTGTLQQQVARIPSTTRLTATPESVVQGQVVLISVSVAAGPGAPLPGLPPLTGAVSVTVTSASGAKVSTGCLLLPGLGGICLVPAGELTAAQGPYTVTANYAGDAGYAPGTASTTVTVTSPRR